MTIIMSFVADMTALRMTNTRMVVGNKFGFKTQSLGSLHFGAWKNFKITWLS